MLGKRACPDGHENALDAQYCAVCGSDALVDGVACIRLGVLTFLLSTGASLLLLGVGWMVLRPWLQAGVQRMFCYAYQFWHLILSSLLCYSLLYLFLPEGWRKRWNSLLGLWLKLLYEVASRIGKLLMTLFFSRRTPPQ